MTSKRGSFQSVTLWCCLFLCFTLCNPTMLQSPTVEDTFKQCLLSQPQSTLGHCLGIGAISKLQSWDSDPEFDLVDGVKLTKDTQEFRDGYNFADQNPSDFRSIVDSFSHVFSHRNMLWDMGFVYPGLSMRVAPSVTPASTLEFVLDPHREAVNVHSLKETGTARILARQFLVPFLLGFKFNAASLVPVMFGILALIAKKAVFLSKIALVASSAFGLASLLFNSYNPAGGGGFPEQYHHGPQQFHNYGGHYRHPEAEIPELLYRGITPQNQDKLRLYANLQEAYDRSGEHTKGRNFAWDEDEKVKKKNST